MFADQRGSKQRPAIVLSSAAYLAGRQEVVIAAVTSNTRRRLLPGDTAIQELSPTELPKPSVVTGILRTVKQADVTRAFGSLSARDLRAVEDSLREALAL
ncbi:MAG: type II toxin-antitoxin system PemK/MazF family toxin [Chloroflexi bacterium]|nr:type II toxin-antitoxin system PemK/MazF family toxin [Chloroflexota bacterium]